MLRIEQKDEISVVYLEHPPVNALDREFLQAIADGFAELESSDAQAVVLTAEGSAFSAGADLFRVISEDDDYVESAVPSLTAAFRSLFEFPRPVVAAVNGHAIAGGAILACACDYRIMADGEGRIGISELRVGVPFPTYAIEIMRFAVASQHFQELVYLAKAYRPADALTKGLIDEVVAPEQLMDRALEVAGRLARIPAASFSAMKRIVRRPALDRVDRYGPEHDARAKEGWTSAEMKDSIRAFLKATFGTDKRPDSQP